MNEKIIRVSEESCKKYLTGRKGAGTNPEATTCFILCFSASITFFTELYLLLLLTLSFSFSSFLSLFVPQLLSLRSSLLRFSFHNNKIERE